MNTILNNPYRTVGLLVGASVREQERQVKRLKQFIEAEQDPQDDFSFPTLGNLHRTLEEVNEAASKLNLDSDKMNAALFWFWNGKPVTDEAAFEAMKDGDIERAYQIWENLITETEDDGEKVWRTISNKNFSAYHNSSVLSLVSGKGSFVSAVVANIKFIESDFFDRFVNETVDETYKVSKKNIQLNFLKTVFENIDNKKLADLVKYLEKYKFAAKVDFHKIFVQKPVEQIEQKIEIAKNKRKSSKVNAAKAGQELFSSTGNDLEQIKSITGISDIKYTSIADKLANEILQCSIDYFNDSQEKNSIEDYTDIAVKLAKQAKTIAAGNLTKDRIKDNISTLEEMKYKEISQAIHVLKSIKEAYETNKAKITAEVSSMPLGYYNQSINWSKVIKMIENSLDWDKVVSLIQEVIPEKNIVKIKNIQNVNLRNEYESLVDFVMDKLSYSRKNKIKYICYWNTVSSTSPPSSSQSEFSFADNAWWIFGIGIALLSGILAENERGGAGFGESLIPGFIIGAFIGWIVKKNK